MPIEANVGLVSDCMEWSRDLLGAGRTSSDAMPSGFIAETLCDCVPGVWVQVSTEKDAWERLERPLGPSQLQESSNVVY